MNSFKIPKQNQATAENAAAVYGKYSKEAIFNPSKIGKGKSRWNQCVEKFSKINEQVLKGPILDCGSGVGYFVYEGLQSGIDIWGVDRGIGKIKRYQQLIKQSLSPGEWSKRCLVGDGTVLPFPSDSFSAVTSWWVLEHIADFTEAIHEIIRITQPEGLIVIRAQDARSGWEGHCKIPWIHFLSGSLARVWIEEFGSSPAAHENVYDFTQPQVVSILEEKGCRIISKALTPPVLPLENIDLNNCTEEQICQLARAKKVEYETGLWRPNPDGLYLYAQKI
jgi:ubiquinone/menaquinone biosynthesis C-methylase UbiE